MGPDPFGTEALRSSVLRAWRDSPTRFTEDTNAEHDLRVGGYRDRLFVELAQNAADAAAEAGVAGRVRVSLVADELRVANTGAPLDAAGVASLASLRASAKREGAVGRFGVGFAAVLAVTSEPRIVSRTGGVGFSEERTRAAAGRPGEDVPILRLPWPLPGEPGVPAGFDTEVRLPLRVEPEDVLDRIAAEVPDLLLALPWLSEVEVAGRRWSRSVSGATVTLTGPDGVPASWLTHGGEGWMWAVPLDDGGVPRPLGDDVLHTPTPTDERLSLPARLFAAVPVEPSRRRVLAGEAAREELARAAASYPGLARSLPAEGRLALVPAPTFPLSEVDTLLREHVVEALASQPWLPAAAGDSELAGRRASVLELDAPELTSLLAGVVPGLVAAPLCGGAAARALTVAGVGALGVAGMVEALTGIERPPSWWRSLYDVLLSAVDARAADTDELGALPVPLADGRTVPGPRGTLLLDDVVVSDDADASDRLDLEIPGLHVVHPDARHPLLERLGATRAGPGELLAAPALREAVERSVEDARAGVDVRPLADAVLRLVTPAGGARELGGLALPARDGWRRADELVHPDSELLDVLDPGALGDDAPLDVVDATFAARWPLEALTAVGVLDTFAVPGEEPGEPEADGDADEPPLRDLDLVADDAWPAAMRLLASRPETWRVLTAPDGRARRWLSRYALLADAAPGEWRLPSAESIAGLFEPVPEVGLSEDRLRLLGVRADLTLLDADDVVELGARLADPARSPSPGLVLRAHAALAAVVLDAEVEPPDAVRAIDGTVVRAEDAVVLDAPWLLAVWPPDRLVACSDHAAAPALAELLDLPLAGDETTVEVTSAGEFAAWRDLPAIAEVADLLGMSPPDGGVVVHERLIVGGMEVPWWFDGALHTSDTERGLAAAFAWAANRWLQRHLIATLLDDPDPRLLLG